MCTELLERNFEVLPEQNVAIVRTLDDRTHYVPLQSFGDSLFEKKRAATLACPLLRELTVLEEDGSVAMYGANDIVAPVRIRMAKDIPGTFQAVEEQSAKRRVTLPPGALSGTGIAQQLTVDAAMILSNADNDTLRELMRDDSPTTATPHSDDDFRRFLGYVAI